MPTQLYWIDGPWPGRLAVAPRPRGGDWLEDEVSAWQRAGVDDVLSLLTAEEENDLELINEAETAKSHHLKFFSFPIEDRQVPASEFRLTETLEKLNADLSAGNNVMIHCRQGIGRSGLVAACLLVTQGWDPGKAVEEVSAVRGVPVPETAAQRKWIDHYAALLAGSK